MPDASSWSLAMIVRDEEAVLGRILEDASPIYDQLVVVDTGSTDGTKAVAGSFGAEVVDFEWVDDFAAARNRSFELCTGVWILWLDADDRIPPESVEAFLDLKAHLAEGVDVDAAMLPYRWDFSETDPAVCLTSGERERVIRNDSRLRWEGRVHESVPISPDRQLPWPGAWVEHRPRKEDRLSKKNRNLRILEDEYGTGDRSPRVHFYLGNEYRDHERWEEALDHYQLFLDAHSSGWEAYAVRGFMALCAGRLGREDERLDHLRAAVQLDPTRAEAWMEIGNLHLGRREWTSALPYLSAAASLERPDHGLINEMAYSWGPWDLMAACHAQRGQYAEAIDETMEALRLGAPERRLLLANIERYLTRFGAVG